MGTASIKIYGVVSVEIIGLKGNIIATDSGMNG